MDIFVGNLPYDTSEEALEGLFSQFGPVARVKILTDRDSGRSRGIAFVTMDDFRAANDAIKELDGSDLGGRAIKVNQARPREERSGPPPRSGGGGGGGGGFRRRDRY